MERNLKEAMAATHRAYSVLDIKEIEESAEFYTIRGIATTPTPDRMGDVVEPMGANFVTPMPLLWQHDSKAPVGRMVSAKATKQGIPFEARIPKVTEPGRLKDRIDEAIHSLKYGLVAAVSIGFRALADGIELLKSGGLRFLKWEWLELSLVTIPANGDATITSFKSFDAGEPLSAEALQTIKAIALSRAASGNKRSGSVRLIPRHPGKPEARKGAVQLIPRTKP